METPEQQHLHPYKTTIISLDIFFVFSRAYLAASPPLILLFLLFIFNIHENQNLKEEGS